MATVAQTPAQLDGQTMRGFCRCRTESPVFTAERRHATRLHQWQGNWSTPSLWAAATGPLLRTALNGTWKYGLQFPGTQSVLSRFQNFYVSEEERRCWASESLPRPTLRSFCVSMLLHMSLGVSPLFCNGASCLLPLHAVLWNPGLCLSARERIMYPCAFVCLNLCLQVCWRCQATQAWHRCGSSPKMPLTDSLCELQAKMKGKGGRSCRNGVGSFLSSFVFFLV